MPEKSEFFKPAQNYFSYYLRPGYLYVTESPTFITTILGSCISVCLNTSDGKCAGINHYIYPVFSSGKKRNTVFGDVSLEVMLGILCDYGYRKNTLVAQIFGGASMADNSNSKLISDQNISVAVDWCTKQGIQILYMDTGGINGRKLTFNTASGKCTVNKITSDKYFSLIGDDLNQGVLNGKN